MHKAISHACVSVSVLQAGGTVVPAAGTVYAQAVQCTALHQHYMVQLRSIGLPSGGS